MNRTRLRQMAETSYPAVQLAMSPNYRGLRDAEIEALLVERFPGAAPEDVENFMKTLQKIGKVAAPIAQKALPGVIQGASAGMVAGPWGALAGGLAGGAASLLSGGGPKAAPGRPAAPAAQPSAAPRAAPMPVPAPVRAPGPRPLQAATPAPAPAPAPALASPAAISSLRARAPGGQEPFVDAAARLILLLSRPQIQQALLALLLGDAGRRSVSVRGRAVPVEAFADALAELAGELAETAFGESPDASADDWIADVAGAPLADPTNPAERAALLLANLMTESLPPLRSLRPLPAAERADAFDADDSDEDYDALETYDTWMEEV